MPPSRIPVPVKKTYSDVCLYSAPQVSPLELIRNNFERSRLQEKERIRAIASDQLKRRKNNHLNTGDCGYYRANNVMNEAAHITLIERLSDNKNVQTGGIMAFNLQHNRPVLPEKRSAGRDRSYPLESISNHQSEKGKIGTGRDYSLHEHGDGLFDNTYTLHKTPTMSKSPASIVHHLREHKLREQLPPVRRTVRYPVTTALHDNHLDDQANSSDDPMLIENCSLHGDSEKSSPNSQTPSSGSPNINNHNKLDKPMHHFSTPAQRTRHNNVYAFDYQGNSNPSCTPSAHDDVLLIVPNPPVNDNRNAYNTRRQMLKQSILKQQKLKMLNCKVVNFMSNDKDDIGIDESLRHENGQTDSNSAPLRDSCETEPSTGNGTPASLAGASKLPYEETDSRINTAITESPSSDRSQQYTNGVGRSRRPWRPTVDPNNENIQIYLRGLDLPTAVADDNLNFVKCTNCNRSFAADRIKKHSQVCTKAPKRRKVFDPVKMRVKNTDFASYVNSNNRQQTPKPKKSHWREHHENFVAQLQYARKLTAMEKQGGQSKNLPPPPPTNNPDYVQCPTCGRKFSEKAAERHIPWCQSSRQKAAMTKNNKSTRKH